MTTLVASAAPPLVLGSARQHTPQHGRRRPQVQCLCSSVLTTALPSALPKAIASHLTEQPKQRGSHKTIEDDYPSFDSVSSGVVTGHGGGRLKRSRSLPQDEFRALLQKLKELEQTDSFVGGRVRDSGFNSEQLSGIFGSEHPSQTGSDIPSAIFGDDLHSGFLEHYGLDGPLAAPTPNPEGNNPLSQIAAPIPLEQFIALPSGTSTNTRKKRKEELKQSTIRQHYYPEGGWGYVIVLVAFLVQMISHGLHMSYGVLFIVVLKRWGEDKMIESAFLGSLSVSIALFISPLTIGVCLRKSTRLTAVIGGLVAALGCLFSSFASQYHQLFLSFGLIVGIGVGMTRDAANLMVGQYFKRKREMVEMVFVSGSGLGITVMSMLISDTTSSLGWRIGLQSTSGLVMVLFFLGTFYRSASLYHPQRRAILHLKTQKRKIKNKDKEKNKIQDDRLPFFDFATLKSRTVQIILSSIFVAFIGANVPLFLLPKIAYDMGLETKDVLQLTIHLGSAWICGVLAFGLVIVNNSSECRIARQYLCQAALVLISLAILTLKGVDGMSGFILFAWLYGIGLGGYVYTLRMYLFEKVRARNFARVWGFAQLAMAAPNLLGFPIALFISPSGSESNGYYFCTASVLLSAFILVMVDVHKNNLRRRKRQLHHTKSIGSTATGMSSSSCPSHPFGNGNSLVLLGNSASGGGLGQVNGQLVVNIPSMHSMGGPDLSEGAMGVVSMGSTSSHASQRNASFGANNFDDGILYPLVDEARELVLLGPKPELTLISEEDGIADMDIPENYFLTDDLEYLENITSCNKVENCVMLSEFEQNLSKVSEDGNAQDKGSKGQAGTQFRRKSRFGRLFSSSARAKRPITVIEENSV